jgi:hypothetical protein
MKDERDERTQHGLANSYQCWKCAAPIFIVTRDTPRELIVRFAQTASFPGAEDILQDGWTHSGSYCPQCGLVMLVEEPRDAFIEHDDHLFRVYLDVVGPHRHRVILYIRETLQLSPRQARV